MIAGFALVVQVCRDPHDNFLLALCQDAADFLLTGDQNLLVLGEFGGMQVPTRQRVSD